MHPDLKYQIAIGLIPGIGCVTAKKIIAYLGSVEAVFREKKQTLLKIPGVGEILAEKINISKPLQRAEEEIEFLTKYNIQTLFYLDESYPQKLALCEDSPLLLYSKGHFDYNKYFTLAIVGTRNATPYGKHFCDYFIHEIKERNYPVCIVSGLAYGIDIQAHASSIKNNVPTVAVLAHGLDTIYPSAHKNTAKKMMENGAIVTEFMSQTIPDKPNFVKRNRIAAGMADATLVVESGIRGGALITAQQALSYNREVFALPGRRGDSFSEGCNWLIKRNMAALLDSMEDFEYYMGWDNQKKASAPSQTELFARFTGPEKEILNLLREKGDLQIDQISLLLKIPVHQVSAKLFTLEFEGLVQCLPGKVFRLV